MARTNFTRGTYKDTKGNESELQLAYIVPQKHFKKGEFFMVHKGFMDFLISEQARKLGKSDLLVLFALLKRVQADNRVERFRQSELAEELNTQQQNISRSVINLKKHDIIYFDSDSEYFYFNDTAVFTGETAEGKKRKRAKKIEVINGRGHQY